MRCEACGTSKAKLCVHQIDDEGVTDKSLCLECGMPYTVQPMEVVDAADGDIHFRVFLLPKEMSAGCERRVPLVRWAPCGACGGEAAKAAWRRCDRCKGAGVVSERVKVRVTIPPRVAPKKLLRVRRQGNVRKADMKRGDLYLHVSGALELVV